MRHRLFLSFLCLLALSSLTGCASVESRLIAHDKKMVYSARPEGDNHLIISLPDGAQSLARLRTHGQVIIPEKSPFISADPRPLGDYYNNAESYGGEEISAAYFILPDKVPWVTVRIGEITHTIKY